MTANSSPAPPRCDGRRTRYRPGRPRGAVDQHPVATDHDADRIALDAPFALGELGMEGTQFLCPLRSIEPMVAPIRAPCDARRTADYCCSAKKQTDSRPARLIAQSFPPFAQCMGEMRKSSAFVASQAFARGATGLIWRRNGGGQRGDRRHRGAQAKRGGVVPKCRRGCSRGWSGWSRNVRGRSSPAPKRRAVSSARRGSGPTTTAPKAAAGRWRCCAAGCSRRWARMSPSCTGLSRRNSPSRSPARRKTRASGRRACRSSPIPGTPTFRRRI